MSSVILENSENGNPMIFYGKWSWERLAEKGSAPEAATWRAKVGDLKLNGYREFADFLEHIFRNPDEVTAIDDHPELDDDDIAAAEWINSRIAKLDAVIVKGIATRKEAKIQIGRALNEQKRILGHGRFEPHVSEVLGSMISLRTSERYMKLAKEHNAEAKIDRLSLLNSGSDAGAKDVKDTTQRARGEVKSKVSKDKPQTTSAAYNLPLPLSSSEAKAVDELRATPAWPVAQQSIILVLRRFCANHGIEIGTHKEEA